MMRVLLLHLLLLPGLLVAQRPFEGHITYRLRVAGEEADAYRPMMAERMHVYGREGEVAIYFEDAGAAELALGWLLLDGTTNTWSHILPEEQVIQQKEIVFLEQAEASEADAEAKRLQPEGAGPTLRGWPTLVYEGALEMPYAGGDAEETIWVARDHHWPLPDALASKQGLLVAPATGGRILLKRKLLFLQDGLELTLEVEDIRPGAPADSLFALPSGYKRVPFDPRQQIPAF